MNAQILRWKVSLFDLLRNTWGALLVVASLLKLWSAFVFGMQTMILPLSYLSSSGLRECILLTLTECEFLIGIFLLMRASRRVQWCFMFLTSALFAAISAWQWIGDHSSCGCFGPLKIAPPITFFLDVAFVVLALAVARRVWCADGARRALARSWSQ